MPKKSQRNETNSSSTQSKKPYTEEMIEALNDQRVVYLFMAMFDSKITTRLDDALVDAKFETVHNSLSNPETDVEQMSTIIENLKLYSRLYLHFDFYWHRL